MQFFVSFQEEKKEVRKKVEIPNQINALVNIFKGTIVAGKM